MLELLELYTPDGPERVGFVLTSGEVMEAANMHSKPTQGFRVDTALLVKYKGVLAATWHTHPGSPSNLSAEDYRGFKAWPKLRHYIIGEDGVRCYVVKDGAVVEDSAARLP